MDVYLGRRLRCDFKTDRGILTTTRKLKLKVKMADSHNGNGVRRKGMDTPPEGNLAGTKRGELVTSAPTSMTLPTKSKTSRGTHKRLCVQPES